MSLSSFAIIKIMKTPTKIAIVWLLILLGGCVVLPSPIKTNFVSSKKEIKGKFHVILYGGNFLNDSETLAFLDRTDDEIDFLPYAPLYEYKIYRYLNLKQALRLIDQHFYTLTNQTSVQIRRILSPEKTLLGYEIRPIYQPLSVMSTEQPLVHYQLKANKLIIYIQKPWDLNKDTLFNHSRPFDYRQKNTRATY